MLAELRRLVPHLRRRWWSYAAGAVAIVASVALKLWIPELLGGAIDQLRALKTASLTPQRVAPLVTRAILTIAATALCVGFTRAASRILILGNARRIAHDLRSQVFAHLLRLAPSFYVRNPTGQIMSRCINDMQNVQGLTGPVIMYLAETTVLFAWGIAMMLRIDPKLTCMVLAPFPFFLIAARRIAVRIQEGSRAAQNALADLSAKADESLSGQLVIKTLAIEDFDRWRFEERCHTYRRRNLRVTRYRAILIPMTMGLTALTTTLVLSLGGPRVVAGSLSLGSLITMVLYVQMLAGPTRTLGFVISSLRRGAAALGRIGEILDTPPTIAANPGAARVLSGAPSIRVVNLTVAYPPLSEQPHLSGSLPDNIDTIHNRERVVLDQVSFEMAAGETLGVVGHTGAGKTTLVRALSRQLEIDPGQVLLDGHDILEYDLKALRQAIGFVPQDAFLFSRSLAENIALGAPTASEQAITDAVGAAQLEKDLAQIPDGLEAVIGERGVNLSGGQRQRAALARVLLVDPKLLILDDTLSAVDSDTADAILNALRSFAAKRTTIIVAHRLSTVRKADLILVMEEGRVVERGTHAELIEAGGRYAHLWVQQERDDQGECIPDPRRVG